MKETNKDNESNKIHKTLTGFQWSDLVGRLRVVTTVPTYVPKTVSDQVLLYVDSLTSPTVFRIYFYISHKVNTWKYVNLNPALEVQAPKIMYDGAVDSDGTSDTPFPTGWSCSRTATGKYEVTHNLGGVTKYTVQVTIDDTTQGARAVAERDSNKFDVEITDEGGSDEDAGFNFLVVYTP